MTTLTLLGPQRYHHTLAPAVRRLGIAPLDDAPEAAADAPQIASVTAGWQEREGEIEEMSEHLALPVVDLQLHRRLERAFAQDPSLFRAHRARQNRLRAMHQLYRYRLDFIIQPARELLKREGDLELLAPEREAALDMLQQLDREYLERIAEVHRAFDQENPAGSHPALERQRDIIAEHLEDSAAITIAGGHVAALVNRLRLFRFAELVADKPIVAWSAGAMALAERIVLFHDSPPQGAGNAEVLDFGLGLYSGLLPLPHAKRRLQLDDPFRVELFARRFAPNLCLVLEGGDEVTFERTSGPQGGRSQSPMPLNDMSLRSSGETPARRLALSGRIEELAA